MKLTFILELGMERYRWIIEICVGLLTSGAGWLAGRRARNNAFLSDLQKSIDTLAAKNAEQMNEILKLREEVIILRSENLSQSKEISLLREENEKLRQQVSDLQQQLSNIKTITKIKKDV